MRYQISLKLITTVVIILLCTASGYSQATAVTNNHSDFDNNYLLALVAIVLLLPIYLLSRTFLFTVKMLGDKEKNNDTPVAIKVIMPILLLSISNQIMAQDAVTAKDSSTGLSYITYALMSVILLETLVIVFFGIYTMSFLKAAKEKTEGVKPLIAKKSFSLTEWWTKVNNFRSIEEEAGMDTGHNYDGIRELNNVTPPWFKAAFALSILFGLIYVWRYHIAQSAPLQAEEYRIELVDAEKEKAEFLKTQSNNVDESTVKMLGDADIQAGKTLFTTNCIACHGINAASMPGGVGPNLTDAYWIHKGSIQDIFKTIKYGWPDKGMKSWKENFSPNQIAQLASYVKSVSGTNVPGKDPQGDIYKESELTDSSHLKMDSLKK